MSDLSTATFTDLDARILRATDGLRAHQRDDGHFCFELEADATIPSEYVLLLHALGESSPHEGKIATYLRRIQGEHGGWPLFHAGAFDMSASVKAYFALKMIGDDPDAPHMLRARRAILERGGAERCNVFTRILLALFGEVPWRAVPVMPVELMLMPRWFPVHIDKMSYWARTVLVPLLVLQAKKPRARNLRDVHIAELFATPPDEVKRWPKGPQRITPWSQIFAGIDAVLRVVEPRFPRSSRGRAIDVAQRFVDARLNGRAGLGAIFPAMANSVLMYDALGIAPDDPRVVIARAAIDDLLVVRGEEAYCQPCLSPVWDTALAAHALLEAGDLDAAEAAIGWLAPRQVLDHAGDWAGVRPGVRPGGWAFQYDNPDYPDTDDTAAVATAMHRHAHMTDKAAHQERVARAREWIEGMQSESGGWGAFDADNCHAYLNTIPFADHGALLDPPTADVSARCISLLAQLGATLDDPRLARGVDYLLAEQEEDGSWFGRWGTNYVYGTWSALCALNAVDGGEGDPRIGQALARGAAWLERIQNDDGGWGEDGDSYRMDYAGYVPAPSTASQTAWALIGLMAAGRSDAASVARGIAWLAAHQHDDGLWREAQFTAVGFPRVFYLRYHGYEKFFPLWAMARYRNLLVSNTRRVTVGM